MNPHEAIFRKAMVSVKPEAIAEVARAFEGLMAPNKALALYRRAKLLRHQFAFGAMARGTKIAGTNGAVIPPGRYWIDLVNDEKRKVWINWTVDKPEVVIEKTEWMASDSEHVIETVIFVIPSTANNYGLPGVFFPTDVLGFPTIAGANVQSVTDTVKRPAPMTSLEALAETPGIVGQGLQSGVQYTAQTIGAAAKGATEGMGLSTTKLALIGIGAIVALVLANRMMIPIRL